MSRERIQWIDNAKGFVLLGVCLTHISCSWNIFPYICTCHMAAFFFLSGMLFRPVREWREFLGSKCRTLLLPYIILSLFFLFLSPSLYQLSAHHPGSPWQNQIADLFTNKPYLHSFLVQVQIYVWDIINGHSAPFVAPLWFVYTLFQLNVLCFFPLRRLSKYKHGIICMGTTAALLFILGWGLYMKNITTLFKLPTLVTASAFFIGGFIFNKALPYIAKINCRWLLLMIILLSAIYIYGVKNLEEPFIGYIGNKLDDNIIAYFSASWGGTFLLTLLFIFIDRLNAPCFIGRILRIISQNGMAILALHQYVISFMTWGADTFNTPFLAKNWVKLIAIILFCIITIPIINRYLYICVGKKKPQST